MGLSYKTTAWTLGHTAHLQGDVKRRDSDLPASGDPFEGYRSNSLSAWTGLDLRAGYKISKGVEVEFGAKNASDQKGGLLKNFNYPFDYRIEPRTFYVGLRLN